MKKPEDIKITHGVTDIEYVMKHLEDKEKKARKEQWLKENYGKRKGTT